MSEPAGGPRITTDPAHGGRWTSLRAGGREWLWHRAEPRREGAAPGEEFADAGGVEECVPTVRGTPDHGDAWARRWTRSGGADDLTEAVECPRFRLTRRIRHLPGRAVLDYRLAAEPGLRFIWAAHALLDLSEAALLDLPAGTPARLYEDGGAAWTPFAWPHAERTAPGGTFDFGRLGPDDGTALGAIACGGRVAVHDGPRTLRFTLETEDAHPLSTALWRNLRGFPARCPYRSTGVEPMLGRAFDLAAAQPSETATVPSSGETSWRLTVTEGAP